LETDAFVFRSWDIGDGAILADAVTSSYEHLKTYMPWARPDATASDYDLFCRRSRAKYLTREDFTLGIFDADGRRVLGGTGFHLRGRTLDDGYGEIGMWIRADAAHRGLGTRVLLALLEWGFSDAWRWERLEWRCDTRNVASARVAEKAGMQLEGCLRGDLPIEGGRRDTLLFGALRSEWRRVV
jgi:RimJ/RimL family protein N-acetyltransferase